MMVQNGLFTADGRLNMDKVRELGWDVAGDDGAAPGAAPGGAPVAHR